MVRHARLGAQAPAARPRRALRRRRRQSVDRGAAGSRSGRRPKDSTAPGLGVQVAADPDFKRTVAYTRVTSDPARDHTAQLRAALQEAQARRGVLVPLRQRRRRLTGRAVHDVAPARLQAAGAHRVLDVPVVDRGVLQRARAPRGRRTSISSSASATSSTSTAVLLPAGAPTRSAPPARSRSTARSTGSTAATRGCGRSWPATPHLFMWDDHEVVNNYWREGAGGATVDGFAERQADAYRAWFEHQPVPVIDGTRIYRSVRVGGLVDLFLVDERQYKDAQPCGDLGLTPCADAATPGRDVPRSGAEGVAARRHATFDRDVEGARQRRHDDGARPARAVDAEVRRHLGRLPGGAPRGRLRLAQRRRAGHRRDERRRPRRLRRRAHHDRALRRHTGSGGVRGAVDDVGQHERAARGQRRRRRWPARPTRPCSTAT